MTKAEKTSRNCGLAVAAIFFGSIILAYSSQPDKIHTLTCHNQYGRMTRTLNLVGSYGYYDKPYHNEASYFYDRNGKYHLDYGEICQ